MSQLRNPQSALRIALLGLALLAWPAASLWAEITMKILVVNPSETEVKEFAIRSPLPPEVKPEHVLDADGLKVEYDSQAGTHMLVGTVTLKPKESVTRRVLLEDVWVIPVERVSGIRREAEEIIAKIEGSSYEEQGQLLAEAIGRHLSEVEESQQQPFANPQQHISRYRENLKTLQLVESDLVSLRQLMVMAKLAASGNTSALDGATEVSGSGHERGQLSVLATWRLIFIVLGLLGFVSLSFFLVWQRQLKEQLAKQAARDEADPSLAHPVNGQHGASASASPRPLTSPTAPGSGS